MNCMIELLVRLYLVYIWVVFDVLYIRKLGGRLNEMDFKYFI